MAEEKIEDMLKKIPKEKLIRYLRETVEKHSALLTFTFLSIKEGYDTEEDEDVQQIKKVLSALSPDSDLLAEERKKITELLGMYG